MDKRIEKLWDGPKVNAVMASISGVA